MQEKNIKLINVNQKLGVLIGLSQAFFDNFFFIGKSFGT